MFSLRTRENRFDLTRVKQGIEYAHALGKKIYLTANIYAHNSKIEPFLDAMEQAIPLGADAWIMSDPGLIDIVKERYPQIEIHLSTQANNTNWAQARFWRRQGISRVILARELSLSEIQEITQKNPELSTEVFVHGAMCMAYSGRCLLSTYFNERASNSGVCTQSCRWKYELHLEEEKRPDQLYPVQEDEYGTYFFNSKDLCALKLIPKIIQTGVHSLKIEGRNKNHLYLATVIRVYRQALDTYFENGPDAFEAQKNGWIDELRTINQRGYTQGFFEGSLQDAGETINYKNQGQANRCYGGTPLANHLDPKSGRWLEIEIKNKISVGDLVEWVTPKQIIQDRITRIINQEGLDLPSISPGAVNWNPKIQTAGILDLASKLDLNEFSLLRCHRPTKPIL